MNALFKGKDRVTKIWNCCPINNIEDDIQYALIISLFFKKANKRVEKEKTKRDKILLALSEDSQDNDGEDAEVAGDVDGTYG